MEDTADQAGETTGAPAPPPPPPPPPPATVPAPVRRSRRGPLWIALAVVLVAGVAGGLVVANAGGGGDPDADEVLHDARTALAQAHAYRFHLTTTDHMVVGEAGGAGTDTTVRSVTDGEVRGHDWHVREDAGMDMGAIETTLVGGRLYVRTPDDNGGPGDWELWPVAPTGSVDDLVAQMSPDELLGDVSDEMGGGLGDEVDAQAGV